MNAHPQALNHARVTARRSVLTGALLLGSVGRAHAQPTSTDSTRRVSFGGFVDAAYAYDMNRPAGRDRAFTTQPARHNEFNINLAFIEAKLSSGRVRGRLALQAGTSVQANYAGEPRQGVVSGPDLARLLQEAYGGYHVTNVLWIDAGIFYSNSGMEGWTSRDSPAYTRSLVADFSPYYSTGVRAQWQVTPRLAARIDLINGWQNISESNDGKSLGLRLDLAGTPTTTVSWYGYAGREPGSRRRLFNGVGLTSRVADRLDLLAQVDVGQERGRDRVTANTQSSTWYGATVIGRLWIRPTWAIAARVERFADGDQIIVATGSAVPFRANSASIGVDVRPEPRVLWRTEARGYAADGVVFPTTRDASGLSKRNEVFVTSLALTF